MNTDIKFDLFLCAEQGGFLYQHRPDLFPDGRLSDVERHLWSMYYEERQKKLDSERK